MGGGEQGGTPASALCEHRNICGENLQNATGKVSAKTVLLVVCSALNASGVLCDVVHGGSLAGSSVTEAGGVHNSHRSSAVKAARGPLYRRSLGTMVAPTVGRTVAALAFLLVPPVSRCPSLAGLSGGAMQWVLHAVL